MISVDKNKNGKQMFQHCKHGVERGCWAIEIEKKIKLKNSFIFISTSRHAAARFNSVNNKFLPKKRWIIKIKVKFKKLKEFKQNGKF